MRLLPPLLLLISFSGLSTSRALLPQNSSGSDGGFSIELIHYDSPLSPLYNASETESDRLVRAFRRFQSRLSFFHSQRSSASSLPQSAVTPSGGDYVMTLSIGTPPVKRPVVADTGSDLTWLQCKPCSHCYTQVAPLFDPRASSSYKTLPCRSQACNRALDTFSCGKRDECRYSFWYADKSYTKGELAAETFTFSSATAAGGAVRVPDIALGCGTKNDGTFNVRETGLAGLGRGPLSLVAQMGPSIGWKFSYCLVPPGKHRNASILSFGERAAVAGPGSVSIPLVTKKDLSLYYLTLEQIIIGGKSIRFSRGGEGNVFSDSGTRFTLLPSGILKQMVAAFSSMVDLERVEDPYKMFDLCYAVGPESKFPTVKFRFTGGELVMGTTNVFFEVSDGVTCLAVLPSEEISVLGNIFQQNFKVGFDLVNNRVSFLPADCSRPA